MSSDLEDDQFRVCKACNESKQLSKFRKERQKRGSICTRCVGRRRREREANDPIARDKINSRARRWKRANPDKIRAQRRQYQQRTGRHSQSEWEAELEAARIQKAKAWEDEKERRAEQRKLDRLERIKEKPWLAIGISEAERFRLRYRLDPIFNLKQRQRAAAKKKRRVGRFGDLIRASLKLDARSKAVENKVGYSIADLKAHLEKHFSEGMTWDIFLTGAIHIDHRKPLSAHDLDDEAEFRAAWSLENIQPLWARDNLRKGAKLDWQPAADEGATERLADSKGGAAGAQGLANGKIAA